ncbi:MAG: Fe2+-dependent dioxygenase, partial [Asticcacaulis sp.]
SRVRHILADLPFRDGRLSAGATARQVKANSQADADHPKTAALADFVRKKLMSQPLFANYARPARWSKLLFSRYGPDNAYGLHTDDALMRDEDGDALRTDLSFTLFLADPETYEGGALSLEGPEGTRDIRLAAGDMVVYRTGLIHQVTPVTKGERLACVGWVQSLIRREDQREILFDLWQLQNAVPQGPARLTAQKTIGNLLRMWSET